MCSICTEVLKSRLTMPYEAQYFELETPPSHAFFLLYPLNIDVNAINQNPLHDQEHHHMTPDIINTMLWWHVLIYFGEECLHMHLVIWALVVTLSGDLHQSRCSSLPVWEEKKWWPQVHTMTLSPRYHDVPLHWVSQDMFY